MNWRALHLQVLAVLLGLTILVGGAFAVDADLSDGLSPLALGLILAYHFVIFAGAHLYLAVRGESGDVPLDARWRFITAVLVVLALGSIGVLASGLEPVAGVDPSVLPGAFAAVVMVAYFLYEAREGYRAFREEESL
jgi:hypothetical protein